MKQLLVTGGAGFIGANFCRYVITQQPKVQIVVLDKLTYAGNRDNLAGLPANRFRLIVGDILNSELVDKLVAESDAVVHFAAESHNDRSLQVPKEFVQTNIVGAVNLLEACRKYQTRFHHVSTDEVYGDLPIAEESAKFKEEDAYRPSSPYAATKASADLLVRAWYRSYGLQATISNSSNNFGPYQHVEKFIPRQITNILCDLPVKIYGAGDNVRDWLHVEDHAAAIWRILEAGEIGETYLVGVDNPQDNLSIGKMILQFMGKSVDNIQFIADRPGHDQRYALDATKLSTLGWRPQKLDFETALRETIYWYQSHKSWWQAAKRSIEREYLDWEK